jgi:DNA-binding Lrp family transcriptional regulator
MLLINRREIFVKLKKKRYNTDNNRNNGNNKTTEGHKAVPRSLDAWIIEELLNDAYVSSTEISKKHKAPLSTVQRRRKYLEDTILTRRYEIDLKKQGFRIGELTVFPESGTSMQIAGGIFSKYPDHILSVTVKIDGSIILAVSVYFKTTAEIQGMMEGIHSLSGVENVKFAETVEIMRDKRNGMGKTIARSITK